MTREEAIERIKARFDKWALDDEDMEAIQTLIPELRESEDEKNWKSVERAVRGFITNPIDADELLAWLERQKECLADNNKTSTDEDERIRKEINILYSDIDACITELLKARTDKDSESEGKALFKMEGLMAATLQDLSCIEDYLEKQKEPENTSASTMAPSCWQKEQKPIKWTDLTWKDIVELEGIINNVHYDFSAGIGQESFGKEVLERFRSTKGIEYLDEAEQKCWRIVLPQPHYAFEEEQKEQKSAECEDCAMYLSGKCIHPNGKCENVKSKQEWNEEDKEALDMCLDAIPKRWKTKSGILLTKWLKDNIHLQPKQEWSEEDKEMLECVIMDVESAKENYLKSTTEVVRQGAIIADKELAWLKALRPSWKPSKEQMQALWKLMKYAVSLSNYYGIQKEIESLYNDLNKLK